MKKKWTRRLIWSAVAAPVTIYAAYLGMAWALRTECSNEVLSEVDSPGRHYTATLFERNCGATAPFVRVVGLRVAGTKLEAESRNDWAFVLRGRDPLLLRWTSERHLVVVGGGRDPSAQLRSSWRDVEIGFQ